MGERGTEEGHNAVASHFVHRAFVVMDGFHHPLDHRVEKLAGVFGIAVGEQLHRALQIGKQHSDLLALAFEGRLGGEDLLGELFRGVGVGRRELTRCCVRLEASATLAAELLSGRVARTTPPAQDRETGATFAADFHLDGVIVTALRTLHKSASEQYIVKKYWSVEARTRGQKASLIATRLELVLSRQPGLAYQHLRALKVRRRPSFRAARSAQEAL